MDWNDPEQRRQYNKRYYEKNRERLKAEQRERNAKNVEAKRQYNREYGKKNVEAKRQYNREYRKKNHPRLRAYMRLWRYGVTLKRYEEILTQQTGVCGICRKPSQKPWGLVVDHDHKTGRVRGLLCDSCNVAIGMLGDDPDLLETAKRWVS